MMGYNRQPTYHARTVTALCIKALTGLESRNWPIIPLVIKEQPASSVVSCRIRIALRLYIPPRAHKLNSSRRESPFYYQAHAIPSDSP